MWKKIVWDDMLLDSGLICGYSVSSPDWKKTRIQSLPKISQEDEHIQFAYFRDNQIQHKMSYYI